MLITFEGIEGSGKTTQIRMLSDHLQKKGCAVFATREPGGTVIGDLVRSILLDRSHQDMQPLCEWLLYEAARVQHLYEKIIPHLKEVVLCDRFVDATLAYQGFGRGLDLAMIQNFHRVILKAVTIDRSFLLDLPVEEGLRRAHTRIDGIQTGHKEDRFEHEGVTFHQRVRAGYLQIAAENPQRFVVINAARSPEEVHQEICRAMSELCL